jgi:hypothetical protein
VHEWKSRVLRWAAATEEFHTAADGRAHRHRASHSRLMPSPHSPRSQPAPPEPAPPAAAAERSDTFITAGGSDSEGAAQSEEARGAEPGPFQFYTRVEPPERVAAVARASADLSALFSPPARARADAASPSASQRNSAAKPSVSRSVELPARTPPSSSGSLVHSPLSLPPLSLAAVQPRPGSQTERLGRPSTSASRSDLARAAFEWRMFLARKSLEKALARSSDTPPPKPGTPLALAPEARPEAPVSPRMSPRLPPAPHPSPTIHAMVSPRLLRTAMTRGLEQRADMLLRSRIDDTPRKVV